MVKSKRVLSRRAFLVFVMSGLVAYVAPDNHVEAMEQPIADCYPPLGTSGEDSRPVIGCRELRKKDGGAC